MIYEIIEELNQDNGSNYKMDVLKKHKDNELLQRVLKMTYDKVTFTYGISTKNIGSYAHQNGNPVSIEDALTFLEKFYVTREYTGNKGINQLRILLSSMTPMESEIIEKVINRDLRINMGRSNINKVFKNLIVKPPYTRCEIGTKTNVLKNMPVDKDGNFKNKVYSQEKMDGTFRRCIIDTNTTEISSRPGIESEFPVIEAQIQTLNIDGYIFIGEMTLKGEEDRAKGNGIINSDDIPHDDVLYTVWDMIPAHEFAMSKDEIKQAEKDGTLSLYEDRFEELERILTEANLDNVELIPYKIINNMREAYEHFQEITEKGGEGTVIKSHDMTHKDGNSKKQLKVKLVIELDMRITGFTPGTGKNEPYFGAMTFENDEGTIKGKVGVSSMTEKERDWMNENRDLVIGNVAQLTCNDITQARSNDFHALSHPRYDKLRGKDKETDTLKRALEQKELAMELK